MKVYAIRRPTDFTEGRAFAIDRARYEAEQDAWDVVNHLSGVQGSHPSTWSRERFPSWQAAKEGIGWTGDYNVFLEDLVIVPSSARLAAEAAFEAALAAPVDEPEDLVRLLSEPTVFDEAVAVFHEAAGHDGLLADDG